MGRRELALLDQGGKAWQEGLASAKNQGDQSNGRYAFHHWGEHRHRGGDGCERWVRFLEPMTANILSGHRRVPPYGMAGGEPGKTGVNYVKHDDGRVTELGACGQVQVAPVFLKWGAGPCGQASRTN